MFRTLVIRDSERGLLYKDGRLVKWLEPGKHWVWDLGTMIDLVKLEIDDGYAELTPELRHVMPAGAGEELMVDHDELALVSIEGRPKEVLPPGRWILWNLRAEVTATVVSTVPVLSAAPVAFWPLMPTTDVQIVHVRRHEQALLYVDGALHDVLREGAYAVHRARRKIDLAMIDLREREVQIVGQEVMTADKVTLRVNLIVKLRVVDAVKSVEAVADLTAAIYTEAQMVARRWIAGRTVDQLLEQRNEATETMRAALAPRAATWGADVLQLDVKDVVLPGEMKTILNRVIEAEKQAAANLVLRREETAATRSLANTARMLEANPMLMRLKELEAMKEMAERIDQLTIVAGSQELLSGLRLPALPSKQGE